MKKLLSVLLVLCLLLAFAACGGDNKPTTGDNDGTTTTSGKTEGNGIVSNHVHCACNGTAKGVGDHTACRDADGWIEVGTADELINAIAAQDLKTIGYYALTADIVIPTYLEIPELMTVGICLNGHTFTAATRNMGDFTVTDCKGTGTYTSDKTFTIRSYSASKTNIFAGNYTITGSKIDSRVFYLDGSVDEGLQLAEDDLWLNIYNAKIFRDPTKVSSKSGANLYMGKRVKAVMYNGVITGANVQGEELSSQGKGGNVAITGAGSTFTMHDGEISNGSISIPASGSTTGGYGGNIGMWDGELHILGGVISGGKANGYGGNISTSNSPEVLELKNTVIKDGESGWKFGGNIYLGASDTEVTITNTTISGGKCIEAGGNFFANNTKVVTFENCTITDGVAPNGGGISFNGRGIRIVLKGEMKFSNNEKSDIFMREYASQKSVGILSVAGLTGKAPIMVSCTRDQELTEDTCADGLLVAAEGYTITKAADGKMSIKVG